ncbi:MAG: nickel-dependent hydrogenase large subunit [Thermodesulfobacteriota bacterium]
MIRRSIIPFGPQHPVLPEPIQLRLELEDERVVSAKPVLGYIHRGLEKIAEMKDFQQNAYLIERICGICSFIHSTAYCQGIEEIMGLEVPPRAKYLRAFWSELHRLHSHLLWLGLLADSFGFENLFMQLWRCREEVLDLMELTAGARIMLGTCCVGGVRKDVSPEHLARSVETLDGLKDRFDGLMPVFLDDYTVKTRLVGVGVISGKQAYELGAVGAVAKGAGLPLDLRTTGYGAYGEMDFAPVTEPEGDCHARVRVRVRELYQSLDLIRQVVGRIPDTPINLKVKGAPDGESVIRVEQPRGEVMYYLRGNGRKKLERLRVRTPTFANIPALLAMLPGCELADVPVIVLSIEPCISCTER